MKPQKEALMNMRRVSTVVAAVLFTTVAVIAQQKALEPSAERLQKDVSYLASDALEGRRTGTKGANDASRYIADEFSRLKLRHSLQSFPYVADVELGKGNALTFGPNQGALQVGVDWLPLGFSANGKVVSAPVSVGYGITASELNHDDYAGVNAKGKIAIANQGSPDGDNPHSRFLRFEGVRWKAVAARNAGASALIVVARDADFKTDRFAKLTYDNEGDAGIPVIVVSRQGLEKIQATAEISLSTDVVRKEVPAFNVVGVLEGSDPVLKNENIVIGAHYDHLGRGGEGSGSLAPDSSEIHHGADDNASGTAGLLELARIFSAQRPKLKRTLVFIAFGGEEEGLLGSNYYVNHPVVPLANTVAMINMDMIGRMRDRKLSIGGVGTASEWKEMIREANNSLTLNVPANATPMGTSSNGVPIVVSANGRPIVTFDPRGAFDLTLNEDGLGPSDHSSFYLKQIPVLFFFTGAHNDYHKPSDTSEKINYTDEARILTLVARIVRDLDTAEKRPTYVSVTSSSTPRGGFRVYVGTIPNYADSSNGLLIDGVREASPAAKAGIKAGDRVVKIGDREIKNVYDYTYALGEMKAGQEYVFEVMRGNEKLSLKVTPIQR
jgi:Zn-dependent M28 family amino/carboxypeptidase